MILYRTGQVMVLALVTLTVIILTMLLVFNVTQLTTEKERMQNTADAVAYSVAVVEGRDLNFAAYTNRAMAANQVTIAQLVGLVSWTRYLYNMAFNLNLIAKALSAVVIVPPVAAVGRVMDTMTNALMKGTMAVAKVLENSIVNNLIKVENYI
ncbi:MAG: pilus assembly protein TadG-related protein, partial [Nitrospinota bacterium]|nr:pilus assembly protein TadG-related protein [Nitrospinota bacterium]